MPELSIVMPVFNEEKNVLLVAEKYAQIAKRLAIEVLFVEDAGSTDNTRQQIVKLSKKYKFITPVLISQRGYGSSVYSGLKIAKGSFLAWTHADLQTDPADVERAYTLLKQAKNPATTYVKGRRYGRPLFDKVFTWGMNIFETLILRTPLYEINAQPNVFHRSFLTLLKQPPQDFSFDLYAYYLAKKNNYALKRFPVYFGKRIHGESKWNTGLKAKFKFIKRTLKFSFQLKKLLRQQ